MAASDVVPRSQEMIGTAGMAVLPSGFFGVVHVPAGTGSDVRAAGAVSCPS